MTTPTVNFTLKTADVYYMPKAPLHGSDTAAGFDFFCATNMSIPPRASTLVPTGVCMQIPVGWCGIISPRSSVASKTPLRIGARIIDSDYRGEVMVNLINDSDGDYHIPMHTRIAQIVFVPHLMSMTEVDVLDDTVRGEGGFGSTGI